MQVSEEMIERALRAAPNFWRDTLNERKHIKKMIEAALAAMWQSISTAPGDGRMAIVYRPLAHVTGDQPVAVKRLMNRDQGCWPATVPEGSEACNPTDGACHVTHWQPLPQPPRHKEG